MPTVTDLDPQSNAGSLSSRSQMLVLVVAFAALVFDGVELGLMPVASLSVSQSLLGDDYTPTLGGDWFARFTAALMLGAAIGGIVDSGQKVAHYSGQNCSSRVVAEWNLGGASERLTRVLRGTLLIRSTGRGDQLSGTRVLSRRTVVCK